MTTSNLIGSSPNFRAVLTEVERVAPVDSAVLIQGETGTGKEVIARAIHEASPRRNHRFVALNCAAIPGLCWRANCSATKEALSRAPARKPRGDFRWPTEARSFWTKLATCRWNFSPSCYAPCRNRSSSVWAAPRPFGLMCGWWRRRIRISQQLVNKKLFRADLFYRLNVIPLCLPPLRERVQDIPALTEFFVAKFAASLNRPIDSIPDEVMEVLKAHDWPGNIRELQNFIERAVLFSPGSVLRLPLDLKQTLKQNSESAPRTLADADRQHILETLKQTNWLIGGQSGAANRLGLPRTTLIYKMRKLGIETRRSPGGAPHSAVGVVR